MSTVFVSCPILDRPEFRMIDSVYQAIATCKEHRVRIYVHENDSLISRVRNAHLSVFLNDAKDCDYFMSIDSDLEIINKYPHNNIFTKLLAHDKDFVGGLYALKNDGKGAACASVPMEKGTVHYDSGLLRMRWLSSGCWCAKRSALERLVAAYPELMYDGDDNMSAKKLYGVYIPYLHTFQENGKTIKKYMSEDWAFPVDPDTNVLCENFIIKKMRDISVGDKVIGFDEYPRVGRQKRQMSISTVVNKYSHVLPKMKITTKDGNSVITTADHQWLVKRNWRGSSPHCGRGNHVANPLGNPCKSLWQRTDMLRVGDSIYSPCDNVVNVDINDENYMVGYLNGMWDGDGCTSLYVGRKQRAIQLSVCDYDIIKRVKLFGNALGIKFNERFRKLNSPKYHDHSILNVQSKQIGYHQWDRSSYEKFMCIYDTRKEIKDHNDIWCRGYMAGIFDSEGHLSAQTLEIAQREFPTVCEKIRKYSKQIGYNFSYNGKTFRMGTIPMIHRFLIDVCPAINRKKVLKTQSKCKDDMLLSQRKLAITKIENLNECGEMMCIETDSHTFIANGYASHNCQRWLDIGGEIYADTSIALKHYGKRAYTLFDTDIITKIIQSGMTVPQTITAKQTATVAPDLPVTPALDKDFDAKIVTEMVRRGATPPVQSVPPINAVKTISLPGAGYDLKMEELCNKNNPK